MEHSLRTRLLVIFAVVSLAIVISTVWLTRISFERGFVSYLDQQNIASLESARDVLASHYQEHGNWDTLRGDPNLWRELVEVRRGPPPRPFDRLRREQFDPSEYQEGFPQEDRRGPPGQGSGPEGGMILLDLEGEWIGGRSDREEVDLESWLRVPVESGGTVVGFLVRPPTFEISEVLDRSFVNSQLRSSVLIAVMTLAFALPLALYIAARLLAPVKNLALGVQKITQGNYGVAIEVKSRDELGQLARDISTLANTLSANKTAQQRWISDISHELRTPVAILEGEINAILDGIRQPNAKEIKSLSVEVGRISRLINDLHQLSRSDSGDLSYKMVPTEIKGVLEQSLQAFDRRIKDAGLQSSLSINLDEAWVNGDESRLIQLFGNLLENSCRYTDAPGEIRIEVSGDRTKVDVAISDSSPGVSDEEIPHLFDRLYRVEQSRNRSSGGSGLGLSICQNIALAHGAVIEADKSELGGLKMTCTFPRYDNKSGVTR